MFSEYIFKVLNDDCEEYTIDLLEQEYESIVTSAYFAKFAEAFLLWILVTGSVCILMVTVKKNN